MREHLEDEFLPNGIKNKHECFSGSHGSSFEGSAKHEERASLCALTC